MKLFTWAAIIGGSALAAFQILASPVQAQTFATATIQGTPLAGYTITYTIETKDHKALPKPLPFFDVQVSWNGGSYTDYFNSTNVSDYTFDPSGTSCSFTSWFQFSNRITSANLEFNSKDTNLRLKNVSEKPNALGLPSIVLNASSGRQKVTLVVSGIYDGPPIPDPLPAFSVRTRAVEPAMVDGRVDARRTNDGQKIELGFVLTTKEAGPVDLFVDCPFQFLTYVGDAVSQPLLPVGIVGRKLQTP